MSHNLEGQFCLGDCLTARVASATMLAYRRHYVNVSATYRRYNDTGEGKAMESGLSFDAFRAAVGQKWNERRVRAAIKALHLHPYTIGTDRRRWYYAAGWASQVRARLEQEDAEPRNAVPKTGQGE